MHPTAKKPWVHVLRHGFLDDGTRTGRRVFPTKLTLRCGEKFCALGLLCELAARQGAGEWRGNAFHYFASKTSCETALPHRMADKLGVTPYVEFPFHARHSDHPDRTSFAPYSVQQANDDGLPWPHIADLVDHFL